MKIQIILFWFLCISTSSCSQPISQTQDGKDNSKLILEKIKTPTNTTMESTEIEPIKFYKGIPPNHYPENWYISWAWGGEYPNGFSVIKENVKLRGRSEPNPNLEKTLNCHVDYLGMYHPWNRDRKTDLTFLTATKTFNITLSEPLTTDVYLNEKVSLKTYPAGEKITFLHYMSEGWGKVKIAEDIVEIDFSNIAAKDWPDKVDIVDEWIQLPCEHNNGWVLFDEVILKQDVADYGYSLSSWGFTQDLTLKDLEALKEEVQKTAD